MLHLPHDLILMRDSWTSKEFDGISLCDKRLEKRFYSLSSALSKKPLSPINKAVDDWKACKAAYRFFDNSNITPEKILKPHIENTIRRCQHYPFVLAIQDSSSFNYTNHRSKKDLGYIGKGDPDSKDSTGFYIHPTLAVSPQGLPLGLLSNYFWKRTGENKEFCDEKESSRWVNSVEEIQERCQNNIRYISVADRECDFNDYFLSFLDNGNHFLIRSKSNRKIKESFSKLHPYIKAGPIKSEFQLEIVNKRGKGNRQVKKHFKGRFRDKNGHFKRVVNLKLQFERVHLLLHSGHRNREDIDFPVSVVRVSEDLKDKANESVPIEWILLTSLNIDSVDVAELMIDFYNKRWVIESYFKTLKSGCKVEDCRLSTYKRITAFISLCTVIAWRIAWMSIINRTKGDAPSNTVLSKLEWESLYMAIHKTKKLPEKVPAIRESILWIAQLGGFLNRKGDGNPGMVTIWRGWQRLTDIAMMREILLPP